MNTLPPREGRGWPAFVLGGRLRTSTVVLVIAFCALWWLYDTYEPIQRGPAQIPATEVVPPGFIPDPAYTWAPRSNVVLPRTPATETTTPTAPTTSAPPTPPTSQSVAPGGAEPDTTAPSPTSTPATSAPPTPTTTGVPTSAPVPSASAPATPTTAERTGPRTPEAAAGTETGAPATVSPPQ